ncbi:MAG: threonine/serine dehydratase [Salibacteraceae bacterium]|nr:threonine/serine dehydratase [Salibacteraceae bacterium]MDP4845216.1 threonine/serine dehydratase [Salibacteraceae bacterium]
MTISKYDLRKAYSRVRPFVFKTPVVSSSYLDAQYEAQFFIKSEQFQPIGAFKIRGAANFTQILSDAELKKGLVTHSSGNHAQAVAFMAYKLGIKASVVMPDNSNKVKIANAKKWGAEVILCEPIIEARLAVSNRIARETSATIVPPFDHEWIIEGQATAAMELIADVPDLDYIIAPLGGGGLLSGTALAAHYFSPKTVVIGAEPENASDGFEGFKTGIRVSSFKPNTIADGLRTTVGEIPFEYIKKLVSDIWLAPEDLIAKSMFEYWQQTKHIIEPSCAVPMAAFHSKRDLLKGKKVGIIITGGNVDFTSLPSL